MAPRVEQYSVDGMFLDVRGIDGCIDFEDFGRQLREHVRSWTGLTIGLAWNQPKRWQKARSGHRRNGHNQVACWH